MCMKRTSSLTARLEATTLKMQSSVLRWPQGAAGGAATRPEPDLTPRLDREKNMLPPVDSLQRASVSSLRFPENPYGEEVSTWKEGVGMERGGLES